MAPICGNDRDGIKMIGYLSGEMVLLSRQFGQLSFEKGKAMEHVHRFISNRKNSQPERPLSVV
jgi:hypothetical protein